ncbi:MAG: tyrosine-type recombinase/integrase [Planctomycetota bacterium]
MCGDGRRRSLRLGKVGEDHARSVKVRVDQLHTCKLSGQPMSRDLALWVGGLDDELHGKLAKLELITPRRSAALAEVFQAFLDSKSDNKPGTHNVYRAVRNDLLAFFGPNRDIRTIGTGDADRYYAWMDHTRKLARATRGKRVRIIKQIWRMARRDGLVDELAFDHLSGATPSNPQRREYVPRETVQRVIEACPDATWRLLVALARFGGLRMPSEPSRLTWEDVHWDRKRIVVTASKTEHLAHGGIREVPIFPEIEPHLRDAFELAEPGQTRMFPQLNSASNLRTQLRRFQRRAGVATWQKDFQNLRASCETDLMATDPIHVAAAILGNSPKVALEHYAIVRSEDLDRALDQAVQNPVHRAGILGHTGTHGPETETQNSLVKQG